MGSLISAYFPACKRFRMFLSIALLVAPLSISAQESPINFKKNVLKLSAGGIEHILNVGMPPGWSVKSQMFQNSYIMIDVVPGESRKPLTHVGIYIEPRLNHADALKQIREFASVVPEKDKVFIKIGGWPAVQITRFEWRQRPGQGAQPEDLKLLRIQTYIAMGGSLVVATSTLPFDASPALIKKCLAISSSLEFESIGDPMKVEEELKVLQESDDTEVAPDTGTQKNVSIETPMVVDTDGSGENTRIDADGRGELEIAVLPDGPHNETHVVVALQGSNWVASHDGGATFPDSGHINFGNGDPSIALGRSDDFYIAGIDSGCIANYQGISFPGGPAPFGYDCTGIARSTHGGGTPGTYQFQTNVVNPAVVCIRRGTPEPANACFPDQEHIAADRWNGGEGGGDQIYSTWRNFNSANQDAGLVCSQDSGVNWTLPITLGPNSYFPRISVGQDGFVYVAAYGGGYNRLWKFNSCTNGLALVGGFPVNVIARTPYDCPFAGHDRCDQNPSSQTVAVDDTNPDHIYYSYAQDAGTSNSDSNIFVQHSTDGGLTWPAWPTPHVIQANPAVSARRIMPWITTSEGNAVVTWYEQSASLPTDSTHFFSARVGINNDGNLIVSRGFQVSDVADNWCDSGWDCGTRFSNGDTATDNAAEACPTQPQLAGFCEDGIDGTVDTLVLDATSVTKLLHPGYTVRRQVPALRKTMNYVTLETAVRNTAITTATPAQGVNSLRPGRLRIRRPEWCHRIRQRTPGFFLTW